MTIAPRPWKVDRRDERHEYWTDSCHILDAEGGVVCVLTRGYQSEQVPDGYFERCPSWNNAELIVAAVNAYEQSTREEK